MPNLGIILIFAAALGSPAPGPTASPAPADVCGTPHSNLLAVMDRPSIGYSPCSVKPAETLAEFGYANAAGPAGDVPTYPQGFVRFGAVRNLEIDLMDNGHFDSGFGAKYEFWHDGSRALAMDFLYTMPTGSPASTVGAPVETVNVDYTLPLSSVLSVASTVGAQSSYASALDGANGRFMSLLPSVVLSDQWNPRAQAYVEAFAQTRIRPDGGRLFGMDAALQYLLTARVEADVEAGSTATDVAHAHFVGFGFGVRF